MYAGHPGLTYSKTTSFVQESKLKVGRGMLLWAQAELSAIGLEVQGQGLAWGPLKYSGGGLNMQFWNFCLIRANFSEISGSSFNGLY